VREDINQSFGAVPEEGAPHHAPAAHGGAAYLDMLNSDVPASVSDSKPKAIAAPKRGGGRGASGRGKAKAKAGSAKGGRGARRGRGGDSGLKEI
jgi:hypothetical protein